MMPDTPSRSRPYLKFGLAMVLFWTSGTALSLYWNLRSLDSAILANARAAARAASEKDIVYRSWSTRHGGVYVPVTDDTPPNPYLEDVVDRDVTTTSGLSLTLINPSYMNRQVHQLERKISGSRGHLTSFEPIRPDNAPDDWERKALQSVISGAAEYSEVGFLEGIEYMRLLRPVITEEACLKCHYRQERRVGEVAGGLSISIPMEPFRSSSTTLLRSNWFWHFLAWITGVVGILIATGRLNTFSRRQEEDQAVIRTNLREKEYLLREIHHRVKNNLQVISGMLELQAGRLPEGKARAALREGRDRVMTMALIHQKLYQEEDLAQIPMGDYMRSLAEDLIFTYGLGEEEAVLTVDAQEVRLNLDTAIPLGLVVSELVTNALKYGRPSPGGGAKLHLDLSFREREDGRYELTVADDGPGLPAGWDTGSSSSLGLKLVHTLVEQLHGEISRGGPPGLAWTIVCPLYHGAQVFIGASSEEAGESSP